MKKINKLFVSYKVALQLKELGFNEPCVACYNTFNRNKPEFHVGYTTGQFFAQILAPIHQQVVDWLANKHGIILSIDRTYSSLSYSYYFHMDFDYNTRIPVKGLRLKDCGIDTQTDWDNTKILAVVSGEIRYDNTRKPIELGIIEALKLVKRLKKPR